ncbi:thiol-disulfide oxidoreductase DCC family protein [Marinomonas mediterranea]|uniref:thiol-disulfide oxidoreductase DCC family protein n=1 Tax=Marinomonas mediterranea TaxID=119864 RepID=UPI00234A1C08|nr:DUF393 domain-containing protein [Marinomonas mediterranea]WCN08257.1 DUF393 domain-containing protein [Marinomonas mediterranea]WCN12323.1 DUF393 domain-containing protein [Marinomonas mediterranea]
MIFFYDSLCPLCTAEVSQLGQYDTDCRITFVDIHNAIEMEEYPHIDPKAANDRLHLINSEGQLITGLDATYAVWRQVGKHRWLKLLRLPLVRPIADIAYVFFAKHRYTISYLFTGKKRCSTCTIKRDV